MNTDYIYVVYVDIFIITDPVCPLRVYIKTPVDAFHNMMVLSSLPEIIFVPSGKKLTGLT